MSDYETCTTLQWRHNGRDGVSNHQPSDCLLNRLSSRRSKKTPKLRVTGLCVGNSPVNSPQKWPVTRKIFPLNDIIMPRLTVSPIPAQFWAIMRVWHVNRAAVSRDHLLILCMSITFYLIMYRDFDNVMWICAFTFQWRWGQSTPIYYSETNIILVLLNFYNGWTGIIRVYHLIHEGWIAWESDSRAI